MDYNTSIRTTQKVGYPIVPQATMPAQPVSGLASAPKPPQRKNRQFWIGCWNHSGKQTRMRWVMELVTEKRSLRPKEKGSIRLRALAPLATREMWQEAERCLDNILLAGAPVAPMGASPAPAPAPAAAQGLIFSPGGFTPNQFPAPGHQLPLPLSQAQTQLQPQGPFVPARRRHLELDDEDEIEASQPKRQRFLGPDYTPASPPPQFVPGVGQTLGNYPGQFSTPYQLGLPVVPQPFFSAAFQPAPPIAPQLTLPLVPQSAPPAAPLLPFSVAPALALPVGPQLAPAEPLSSGWPAQTLPQEDLQWQGPNANNLITEETQFGQETQFFSQLGQITNEVPTQSGQGISGVPTQFGEGNHADAGFEEAFNEIVEEYIRSAPAPVAPVAPVVQEADEEGTHTAPVVVEEGSEEDAQAAVVVEAADQAETLAHAAAANEEPQEEDLFAAFLNEEAYAADAYQAPVPGEVSEEDTQAAGFFEAAYEAVVAATEEATEEALFGDLINEQVYGEDANEAPVAEEADLEETNAPSAQSGEEANGFVVFEETENNGELHPADERFLPELGTVPAPFDDDERSENHYQTIVEEGSEQEEVDDTLDEDVFRPLVEWWENEQQPSVTWRWIE